MKPWFKSLFFWFGLLPALFILWLWWDSGWNEIVGYSYEAENVAEFHVQPGRLQIITHNDWVSSCFRGEWDVGRTELGKARPDGPRTGPFFHASWFKYEPHDDTWGRVDGGRTSIGFWFILLVYLAIWSLLFFLWRRRGLHLHRAREAALAMDSSEEGAPPGAQTKTAAGTSPTAVED